jgi:hypothetical protein
MSKLFGYSLSGSGINDRGLLEALLPIKDPCARFGNIYQLDRYDENFKMGKRYKHDHYATYDGFELVSARFRDFCAAQGYGGLEFRPLQEGNFFWLKVHEVLEFDPVARGTRFINYNEKCRGYEEVIGANPVCLKNPAPVPDGFFRTDLFFADGYTKSPVLIVGTETRIKMLAHGLKGSYFEKILDCYPWQENLSLE